MTFRRYLLGTAVRSLMSPQQCAELQMQLHVIALSWDGVAREMRKARERANG